MELIHVKKLLYSDI